MKKLVYLLAVMFVFTSLSAQRPNRGLHPTGGNMALTMPKEDVNQAEQEWLTRMALEEKMAYDFYYTMFNKWNIPMFNKIMAAKLNHKSLIINMLDKYDLSNPVDDQIIGKYSNSETQKLYEKLVSQGKGSLKDALIAAATLEEKDIVDFQKAQEQTDNADLRVLFTNLKKANEHHLRAAVKQLSRLYGYNYSPQYLDKDTFDEIVTPKTYRKHGPRAAGI